MTRIILIILLSGFFNAASAQDKKPVEKPKADSVKSTTKTISDFVAAKAISKKGMFSIHQVGDKYYFEIPDSLLGRELLLTTWLVKVPGGSPKFGGEIITKKGKVYKFDDAHCMNHFLGNGVVKPDDINQIVSIDYENQKNFLGA